jgi:YHS domain-containing protein
MKRFLSLLAATFVTSVMTLVGNNAVGASDTQTLDPGKNTAEKGTDLPAQDDSSKMAKSGPTNKKVNVDSQGIILKGYDAVAYFKQGKPVKGNPAFESIYKGARYLFASSADKADFDKDQAKYSPRYGGYCSYGVLNGMLTDPAGLDAFAVYKGKLYLCGSHGALKEFKTNIDSNIEKADTNWRMLAGP